MASSGPQESTLRRDRRAARLVLRESDECEELGDIDAQYVDDQADLVQRTRQYYDLASDLPATDVVTKQTVWDLERLLTRLSARAESPPSQVPLRRQECEWEPPVFVPGVDFIAEQSSPTPCAPEDEVDEDDATDSTWVNHWEEPARTETETDELDEAYYQDFISGGTPPGDDGDSTGFAPDIFADALDLDVDEDSAFEEVQTTGRLSDAERAEAASVQVAWQNELSAKEGRELRQLFEEHTWGITRQAITKHISRGLTVAEIRLASSIRSIWEEHEEFRCCLGRGPRVTSIPWDMAVRLALGFGEGTSPAEVEWYLSRLHEAWYDRQIRQIKRRTDYSFFLHVFALSHAGNLLQLHLRQADAYSPSYYESKPTPIVLTRVVPLSPPKKQ